MSQVEPTETLPNSGAGITPVEESPTPQSFPETGTDEEKIFWCLDNGIKDAKEIMEKCGTAKSTTYKKIKKWKKLKGEIPEKPPTEKPPVKEAKPFTFKEAKEVKPLKKDEKPTRIIPEEMELTAENMEWFWKSVNDLIPEKHRRPPQSMVILGKLWYVPANKFIEQHSDQNPLMVMAVLATFVVFFPSLRSIASDIYEKQKEKKKKKEIEEEEEKKE